MRVIPRLLIVTGASVAFACGSARTPFVPPASEMAFAATFSPDATGGMRPATTVSASLFLEGLGGENVVVLGPLETAEFTVFDGSARVLARGSVAGPVPFGPDGRVTVQQVLDWEANELGRALTVRFAVTRAFGAPEEGPLVIERTFTF